MRAWLMYACVALRQFALRCRFLRCVFALRCVVTLRFLRRAALLRCVVCVALRCCAASFASRGVVALRRLRRAALLHSVFVFLCVFFCVALRFSAMFVLRFLSQSIHFIC